MPEERADQVWLCGHVCELQLDALFRMFIGTERAAGVARVPHSSMRVTPDRRSPACSLAKSGAGMRDSGTCRQYRRAYNASSSSSSGSGHASHASPQRRRQSYTVERAQPIAAAIWRWLHPSALSRSTTRILRTGNLACATVTLLPHGKEHTVAGSTRFTYPCRHGPEWVAGMDRNT